MKKLNEDINITDPNLAQQYNRGQSLLVQKDQLIVKLQDQINKVEKEKMKIEKELNKISQESAKQQGQEPQVDQQGQQNPNQNDQQTVQVTGKPVEQTSESLLIKIDGDKISIELDNLTDKLTYLQQHDGDSEEIDSIQTQIDGLINKDIEDEDRYADDIQEPEKELLNDEFDESEDIEDEQFDKEDEDIDWRENYDPERDEERFDKEDEDYRWRSQKEEDDYEDLDESEDDETRFSGMVGKIEHNYELDSKGNPKRRRSNREKYPFKPSRYNRKLKAWSDSCIEKYENIEEEIEDIEDQINYLKKDIKEEQEKYSSPSYDGIEGEMEEFWGELTHDQREVLNTGTYNTDKEKIKALKKYGATNPESILQSYYYYYPEFDESLDKERKQSEKVVKKLNNEIEKLEKKLERKQDQLDKMGYPRYMDESKKSNPMSVDNFYDLSEAYVEDDDTIDRDLEKFIDNDYLFYVKVQDKNIDWFIGKVFKTSPDGDWYGVVKAGDDESFEKMSYESEWDEGDIIRFLQDQYDIVEIIDRHEYNDYLEDKDEEYLQESVSEDNIDELWDDLETWVKKYKYPSWSTQKSHIIDIAPKHGINIDLKTWKQIFNKHDELVRKNYFMSNDIEAKNWINKQILKSTNLEEGGWPSNTL